MARLSCLECVWKNGRSRPFALASALPPDLPPVVNASWTRVVRVTVKLPNLPAAWRGRTAALVSDLHLGHVRNASFLRRVVRKLSRLSPDILFIPGDMFDGTTVDFRPISKSWAEFSAPLGSYFIAGNHEQFSSSDRYFDAVAQCGIRVLQNEKIVIDGLQIVGVHYHDSRNTERFRSILRDARLDTNVTTILLVHDPNLLRIAAEAGISCNCPVTRIAASFSLHPDRFPRLWKICLRFATL